MRGDRYIEFSNRPDFDPAGPENMAEMRRQGLMMGGLSLACAMLEEMTAAELPTLNNVLTLGSVGYFALFGAAWCVAPFIARRHQ